MITRKLTSLYLEANHENIFINFASYDDGEWNGDSEECEITPAQLYDLLGKASLLSRKYTPQRRFGVLIERKR